MNVSTYLNMDIQKEADEIKIRALKKKKLLRNFLEGFTIHDDEEDMEISINDYITNIILDIETDINNETEYTYWTDTGITWRNWCQSILGVIDKLDEIQKLSLIPSFFKINYIFSNEEKYKNKINKIKELLEILLTKINEKLRKEGLQIILEENNSITEDRYNKINIQLVFEKINQQMQEGGARKPKKKPSGILAFAAHLKEKPVQRLKKYNIENFKKLLLNSSDKFILVDFNIEYFKNFNIKRFNDIYIKTHLEKIKGGFDYNEKRYSLKRLNENGMMIFCLLNLTSVADDFGLSINKIRKDIFFKYYTGNKEDFFDKLKKSYSVVFLGTKTYKFFFEDIIDKIIYKLKNKTYESSIDIIDRWIVSMFRPYVNSFIIQTNEILFRRFKIKLFIAGGDAMRRYDYDISFTNDIDTKLYIKGAEPVEDDPDNMELMNKIQPITGIDEKEDIIRDEIVKIIAENMAKLRNYLEKNIETVFYELLQFTPPNPIKEKGIEVISFKLGTDIIKFDLLLPGDKKDKYQHFRTRETKKRDDFPVFLYSIDFRCAFKIFNANGVIIKESHTHDISVLDVVVQDGVRDKYDEEYINEVQTGDTSIPVASLEFLLKDFDQTYHTDDRALARISSGKVKKDIERFNRIKDIYISKQSKQPTQSRYKIKINMLTNQERHDKLRIDFNFLKILENMTKLNKKLNFNNNPSALIINDIIKTISKNEPMTFTQFSSIVKILETETEFFTENPDLKKYLLEFVLLNKNIPNQQLNETKKDYIDYNMNTDNGDDIRKNYKELFLKLCLNKDGLLRHNISFSNMMIRRSMNILGITTVSSVPSGRGRPIPRVPKVVQSAPHVVPSGRGRGRPQVAPSAPGRGRLQVAPSAPAPGRGRPQVAPSTPQVAPSTPQVVPSAPRVVPSTPQVVPSTPQVVPSSRGRGRPRVIPSAPQVIKGVPRDGTTTRSGRKIVQPRQNTD
jgi:hypothetical protein